MTGNSTTPTLLVGGIPLVWLVVLASAVAVIVVCALTYPFILLNRWRMKERIRADNDEIEEEEEEVEEEIQKRGRGPPALSIFGRGRQSFRGKWVEKIDPQGQPYYENTGTGEVKWTDPRPQKGKNQNKVGVSQSLVVSTLSQQPPMMAANIGFMATPYGAPGGFGAPRPGMGGPPPPTQGPMGGAPPQGPPPHGGPRPGLPAQGSMTMNMPRPGLPLQGSQGNMMPQMPHTNSMGMMPQMPHTNSMGMMPQMPHTNSMGMMQPQMGNPMGMPPPQMGNPRGPPNSAPPQMFPQNQLPRMGSQHFAASTAPPTNAPPPGLAASNSIRRTQAQANTAPPAQPPPAAAQAPPAADPKFEKYARMQKAGLPEGAVRNAMNRDGLSEAEQKTFFGS